MEEESTVSSKREDKVSIIGIGKLGLCAALGFERKGCHVMGCDINVGLVEALNEKRWTTPEPLVDEYLRSSRNFIATTRLEEAVEYSDLLFIFVDTPNGGGQGETMYDHSKLSEVLYRIHSLVNNNILSPHRTEKHIIINSTVMPGYIANVGRHLLGIESADTSNSTTSSSSSTSRMTLSYNPYFVAQGDIIHGFYYPDMILIGEGNTGIGERLEALYRRTCESSPSIRRMSPESAEITKLAVNCYITLKISYANLIGDIADRTANADKEKILEAVGSDSRIGSKYLKPGYGFGGPCFPRDNRALGYYSSSVGVEPILMQASDEFNRVHRELQVMSFVQQPAHQGEEEEEEYLVFEGVAFKENSAVPIIEESQKLEVARMLASRHKRRILIRDNPAVIKEVRKKYGSLFSYQEV